MRTLPGAGPSQLLQHQAGDASCFKWGVLINGASHCQHDENKTSFSPKLRNYWAWKSFGIGLGVCCCNLSLYPWRLSFHSTPKRCVWFLSPSYVAVFTHPPIQMWIVKPLSLVWSRGAGKLRIPVPTKLFQVGGQVVWSATCTCRLFMVKLLTFVLDVKLSASTLHGA